jgi:Zinc finger C-x8-C-x5-C-x3-H type (and similar)
MVSQAPHAHHRRIPPSRPSPAHTGASTRSPNPRAATQSRPPLPGVRFVEVRLAVPVDSPIQSRIQSPTERRPSLASVSSSGSVSPMLGQRPKSPYGFIPIRRDDRTSQLPHSPFSPSDFRKGVHSPSMMSFISDDTDETASMTLDTSSRMGSPSPYGSPAFSRGSPRPKTPTGRASPFAKGEEDPQRKNRIKTEMCMHYVNNRPCPFGANCTYAHGEEELQMTKLLDLDKAGLVDLETFRTKPCLTWVMTGSWYVTN